jgi:prolipoprotein diacylglyceryltransferase
LDAGAPALMISYAVGRIGCHLSGDGDWGINNLLNKPNWMIFVPDSLWSTRYPHNVIGAGISIPGCTGKYCNILEYPVFPTAIYETIMCFCFFLLLWSLRKKFELKPGTLFSMYLILNGFERFLIEQIRIDSEYNIFGNYVKQSEIIAVLIFIAGIISYFHFNRSHRYVSIIKTKNI